MMIFLSQLLFFVVFVTLRITFAQQLSQGCVNSDINCFSYPNNCVGSDCLLVYKWTTSSPDNSSHRFSLAAKILPVGTIQTNLAWLAIGFSTDQTMGNDDIVLCKSTPNSFSVDHYFSLGAFTPSLMDPSNPRIGIANSNMIATGESLLCTFNREKFINAGNYFDLRKDKFFVFAALGPLDTSGNIFKHELKISSRSPIDFSQTQSPLLVESDSNDSVKMKVHASFMIVAWFILTSIGILLARYYKFIFPDRRIYKLKIWFVLHRPIMISVFLLAIIGLLVILGHKNWKWVNQSSLTPFVHSIFGMITLGLALLQIIIAIFRPHQEHKKRFIFNYFHRILGFSTLTSAIITIFLGVSLDEMNLKMRGIGVMIAWTIWLLVFIVLIEFIDRRYTRRMFELNIAYLNAQDFTNLNRKNNLVDQAQDQMESIKIILFIFHVIIAFGLGICLIYFIAAA